jgi:cobaltochelatase CobS
VVDRDGHPFGAELPPQRHPQLETLLRSISARDVSAARLNVWIAGPAGSGKTHAAKQCAQALDLDFGFHGAMTYAHDLVGFVDAAGRYHETQFVKLYREGGLCLLDELDSGTSEALLTLNAALANGQISIPSGEIISRHPDFACIGAANTFGAGATAEYVGRNKLDAAFLSRFPVKIAWNYDLDLEAAICGNADWAQEVQAARAKAQAAGLKIVIDPRHSIAGAALIAAGMDRAQVAELTYLAGLKPEQVAMLKGGKK